MAKENITSKILKNATKNFYVRFMFQGKQYPVKNFTKLFGCKTEKQTFDKLQEIKIEIAKVKTLLL